MLLPLYYSPFITLRAQAIKKLYNIYNHEFLIMHDRICFILDLQASANGVLVNPSAIPSSESKRYLVFLYSFIYCMVYVIT